MQLEQDTIVAVSTPPGRGGIGIVRLSGARARTIAESMLRLGRPLAAGRVRRAQLLDVATYESDMRGAGEEKPTSRKPDAGHPQAASAEVLDEAVVTFFAAPHSYTTEDVVEIATHGSPVVLEAVLRGAVRAGARLAEPGEFTQRAFLAGRLDLTQAEAVHDLIAAQTLTQARTAAAQLGGSLAQAVRPLKQLLIELIAQLEAGIDFAEDDVDLLPPEEIAWRLAELREPLARLAATFGYGRMLREGFTLAIVGRPNAGKSSLFNCLLERERAIVTAQPGTTRDPIAERLSLGGIPVELVDTAGLREVGAEEEFEAERQGIARSHTALAEADLVLLVVDLSRLRGPGREMASAAEVVPLTQQTIGAGLLADATAEAEALLPTGTAAEAGAALLAPPPAEIEAALLGEGRLEKWTDLFDSADAALHASVAGRPHLVVLNKLDLVPERALTGMDDTGGHFVATSTRTGAGVDRLRKTILTTLTHTLPAGDSALVTNLRQHQALTAASDAFDCARAAAADSTPHEMLLLDLYGALEALDSLTGQTSTDEILHLIFSTFCIGK